MKVSIIMPTYQRPHTIGRTIETIKAQTHENWELIIAVNDFNFDYLFGDSRIRMLAASDFTSMCYARNQAIPHATGDLLCHFDDDDIMFPNYLETFVRTFEAHPKAKMVCCGTILADGQTYYGYGTEIVCLRREYATPTWEGSSHAADQRYYRAIKKANRWMERRGDIFIIPDILCRANTDPVGGLRSGKF